MYTQTESVLVSIPNKAIITFKVTAKTAKIFISRTVIIHQTFHIISLTSHYRLIRQYHWSSSFYREGN